MQSARPETIRFKYYSGMHLLYVYDFDLAGNLLSDEPVVQIVTRSGALNIAAPAFA